MVNLSIQTGMFNVFLAAKIHNKRNYCSKHICTNVALPQPMILHLFPDMYGLPLAVQLLPISCLRFIKSGVSHTLEMLLGFGHFPLERACKLVFAIVVTAQTEDWWMGVVRCFTYSLAIRGLFSLYLLPKEQGSHRLTKMFRVCDDSV